jgi:hypothetical protein
MSRGLWFVAGAGAGVYAVFRTRRAAEAFTPDGMRDRLAGLGVGAHLFATELRAGMDEKENELRERLGLTLDGPPQLVAANAQDQPTHRSLDTTGHLARHRIEDTD